MPRKAGAREEPGAHARQKKGPPREAAALWPVEREEGYGSSSSFFATSLATSSLQAMAWASPMALAL